MDPLNLFDSFRVDHDPTIENYVDVPAATAEGDSASKTATDKKDAGKLAGLCDQDG